VEIVSNVVALRTKQALVDPRRMTSGEQVHGLPSEVQDGRSVVDPLVEETADALLVVLVIEIATGKMRTGGQAGVIATRPEAGLDDRLRAVMMTMTVVEGDGDATTAMRMTGVVAVAVAVRGGPPRVKIATVTMTTGVVAVAVAVRGGPPRVKIATVTMTTGVVAVAVAVRGGPPRVKIATVTMTAEGVATTIGDAALHLPVGSDAQVGLVIGIAETGMTIFVGEMMTDGMTEGAMPETSVGVMIPLVMRVGLRHGGRVPGKLRSRQPKKTLDQLRLRVVTLRGASLLVEPHLRHGERNIEPLTQLPRARETTRAWTAGTTSPETLPAWAATIAVRKAMRQLPTAVRRLPSAVRRIGHLVGRRRKLLWRGQSPRRLARLDLLAEVASMFRPAVGRRWSVSRPKRGVGTRSGQSGSPRPGRHRHRLASSQSRRRKRRNLSRRPSLSWTPPSPILSVSVSLRSWSLLCRRTMPR